MAPSDYDGIRAVLNADRGHQAPLASLTGTPEWRTANYLSNITPQAAALNQGPWERLENAERELAQQPNVSAVYSITGPLFEHPMKKLPHAHLAHEVPSGYWKIVAVQRQGDIVAAAFILHQDTKRQSNFCNYAVTVGAAGIRIPEYELLRVAGKPVLLSRRFDREGATRIPFLSALSMMGL